MHNTRMSQNCRYTTTNEPLITEQETKDSSPPSLPPNRAIHHTAQVTAEDEPLVTCATHDSIAPFVQGKAVTVTNVMWAKLPSYQKSRPADSSSLQSPPRDATPNTTLDLHSTRSLDIIPDSSGDKDHEWIESDSHPKQHPTDTGDASSSETDGSSGDSVGNIVELAGIYLNWQEVYMRFKRRFDVTFARSKKAHFDSLPVHWQPVHKVVDGARSKWCLPLFIDAILFLACNQTFDLSRRRCFNQHKVVFECIWEQVQAQLNVEVASDADIGQHHVPPETLAEVDCGVDGTCSDDEEDQLESTTVRPSRRSKRTTSQLHLDDIKNGHLVDTPTDNQTTEPVVSSEATRTQHLSFTPPQIDSDDNKNLQRQRKTWQLLLSLRHRSLAAEDEDDTTTLVMNDNDDNDDDDNKREAIRVESRISSTQSTIQYVSTAKIMSEGDDERSGYMETQPETVSEKSVRSDGGIPPSATFFPSNASSEQPLQSQQFSTPLPSHMVQLVDSLVYVDCASLLSGSIPLPSVAVLPAWHSLTLLKEQVLQEPASKSSRKFIDIVVALWEKLNTVYATAVRAGECKSASKDLYSCVVQRDSVHNIPPVHLMDFQSEWSAVDDDIRDKQQVLPCNPSDQPLHSRSECAANEDPCLHPVKTIKLRRSPRASHDTSEAEECHMPPSGDNNKKTIHLSSIEDGEVTADYIHCVYQRAVRNALLYFHNYNNRQQGSSLNHDQESKIETRSDEAYRTTRMRSVDHRNAADNRREDHLFEEHGFDLRDNMLHHPFDAGAALSEKPVVRYYLSHRHDMESASVLDGGGSSRNSHEYEEQPLRRSLQLQSPAETHRHQHHQYSRSSHMHPGSVRPSSSKLYDGTHTTTEDRLFHSTGGSQSHRVTPRRTTRGILGENSGLTLVVSTQEEPERSMEADFHASTAEADDSTWWQWSPLLPLPHTEVMRDILRGNARNDNVPNEHSRFYDEQNRIAKSAHENQGSKASWPRQQNESTGQPQHTRQATNPRRAHHTEGIESRRALGHGHNALAVRQHQHHQHQQTSMWYPHRHTRHYPQRHYVPLLPTENTQHTIPSPATIRRNMERATASTGDDSHRYIAYNIPGHLKQLQQQHHQQQPSLRPKRLVKPNAHHLYADYVVTMNDEEHEHNEDKDEDERGCDDGTTKPRPGAGEDDSVVSDDNMQLPKPSTAINVSAEGEEKHQEDEDTSQINSPLVSKHFGRKRRASKDDCETRSRSPSSQRRNCGRGKRLRTASAPSSLLSLQPFDPDHERNVNTERAHSCPPIPLFNDNDGNVYDDFSSHDWGFTDT